MRSMLLLPVAALITALAWLFGAPVLGEGGIQHGALSAVPALVSTLPSTPATDPAVMGRLPGGAGQSRGAASGEKRTGAPAPQGAIMIVPRLGVRVPVLDRGVDAGGHLPIADGLTVTHYTFSAGAGEPGNYVAYGHDDIQGSVFQNLGALRTGDPIELVFGGRRFLYRVTRSRVVWPTDISVLRPTASPTMTLITCTPYMVDTQRIVVNAALAGIEGLS